MSIIINMANFLQTPYSVKQHDKERIIELLKK